MTDETESRPLRARVKLRFIEHVKGVVVLKYALLINLLQQCRCFNGIPFSPRRTFIKFYENLSTTVLLILSTNETRQTKQLRRIP